jgi:hypothetical protein
MQFQKITHQHHPKNMTSNQNNKIINPFHQANESQNLKLNIKFV